MIDFNDVRRESEPTYLVFPRSLRLFLEHALKECQITDWRIKTVEKSLRNLPAGFAAPDKPVLVFASYFNQDDMSRKLLEIQHDADIIRWIDAGCERLIRDIWGNEPPLYQQAKPTGHTVMRTYHNYKIEYGYTADGKAVTDYNIAALCINADDAVERIRELYGDKEGFQILTVYRECDSAWDIDESWML